MLRFGVSLDLGLGFQDLETIPELELRCVVSAMSLRLPNLDSWVQSKTRKRNEL